MRRASARFICLLAALWPALATAQGPPAAEAPASPSKADVPPQLEKLPELLKFVEAEYPASAQAQGIEARVVLLLMVDEKGRVGEVSVVTPAGHGFDEAAMAAARQFEFSPAVYQGQPVPVQITYEYGFVIKSKVVTKPIEIPATPAPLAEDGATTPPRDLPENFKGIVKERGTRTPLANMEVTLAELERTEMSDAGGAFAFKGVPPGKYTVIISGSANHEQFRTLEEISATEVTEASYYVMRRDYTGYEIVVRGKKEKKEVTKRTLTIQEIRRIPGTQGDTLKVVQNLPGVARPQFGSGLLVIRGTDPENSGIFFEGQVISRLYHFGAFSSVINSDVIERIDFIPGGAGVYYGNLQGGVVDVFVRDSKKDRVHGVLDVDMIDASILVEGPINDNMGLIGTFRRSYIDLLLPVFLPDDPSFDLTVAPRYYDYQFLYDWKISGRQKLKAAWIGSLDRLTFLIKEPAAIDPSVRGEFYNQDYFHQWNVKHEFKISDDLRNVVNTAYDLAHFEIRIGQGDFIVINTQRVSVREDVYYDFSKQFQLHPGIDINAGHFYANLRVPRPPREGEQLNPFGSIERLDRETSGPFLYAGAFLEGIWMPTEALKIIPGVRFDYFMLSHSPVVGPRLGTRYEVIKGTTLKASVGQYHQDPNPDETDEIFGNPDLESEWTLQYSAGVEQDITEIIDVDVQGFYSMLRNQVIRAENPAEVYTNEGKGRVYGAEILLRHNPTDFFFGWIAYTLARAERFDFNRNGWRVYDFDETHNLTMLGSFKLPHNWEIGFRFRLATGKPTTPIKKGVYDADSDQYLPIPGPQGSERLPIFHALDLRVDKRFVYETWMLGLYLDIQNVYNNRSVELTVYNFDYTDSQYVRGLPIIPSLGVRAEF